MIFPNLIIFNLITTNLIAINPIPTNRLNFIIMLFSTTINFNITLLGLYWLGTRGFQYWSKWYSYLTKFLNEPLIRVSASKEDLDISYKLELRSLCDYFDFFVFYADISWGAHITKELKLFLMESTFFQVGI